MSLDPNATVRRRDLRRAEPVRAIIPAPQPAAERVRVRLDGLRRRSSAAAAGFRRAAGPLLDRLGVVFGAVTGLGWTVVCLAIIAWGLAVGFGWAEVAIVGATLSILVAICCLFTIGRMNLAINLQVDPQRVVVGGSVAGRVAVRNLAKMPLLPLGLECPVGRSVARYTLPPLAGNGEHEEVMVIPTAKRGVIQIGPVTTLRGDPFGLVRREVSWTEAIELFVHPRTVRLEPVGTGLLRDLEGHTTNDTSMSDLAFHTLREYVPGDDRRYIHWRSSAKASAAAGSGRFLVRQFLDTRRSHIAVVTDVEAASYADRTEFELAVSVAASVALRTLADEMDLTIVCGEHAASDPPPHLALDTFSRADWGEWTLSAATGKVAMLAPDASVAVLVSGSRLDFSGFLKARAHLAPEVNAFAIIVDLGAPMTLRQAGGLTVLTVGTLTDLPVVLRGGRIQ